MSELPDSEVNISETPTTGLTQGKRGLLQKTAKVVGIICIFAAFLCGGILVLSDRNDEVFRATMGASAFFFFMVSLVLSTISNTNLPNLRVDGSK